MPFQLDEFIRLRPFLYHVTCRENLQALRMHRCIHTTLSLLDAANRLDLADIRRENYLPLDTPFGRLILKDQRPLIEANVQLAQEWDFAAYVRYLNGFTYFWPGNDDAPIGSGRRLLTHYEPDGPVVLRIPTREFLDVNRALVPEYSAFNSGAPRFHSGRPAKRGPDLFATADQFPRRAAEVVEVGFRGNVMLPAAVTVRDGGGWIAL